MDTDAPALLAVFGDPAVMRYWATPPLADLAEAAALVQQARINAQAGTGFRWAIARRADDALVGTCSLFHLDLPNGRAELGFALGQAWWGQGLAAEAIALAIGHAFGAMGLARIEADVDPRNAASLRALERMGFRREGYLRERYRVNGEVQDSVLLGLLRRERVASRGEPDAEGRR
jgi:RimJ/RimL family protein N-acetyltransferase